MIKQQFISVYSVTRMITLMMLIMMISFFSLVGFFLYLIEEGESKDLHERVQLALEAIAEQPITIVTEYSIWDVAYENLYQKKDNVWISENIDNYLVPRYGFDFLALYDPKKGMELLSKQKDSRISSTTLSQITLSKIDQKPKKAIHFYKMIDGQLYSFVVSHFFSDSTGEKQNELLVVGIEMTAEFLQRMSNKYRLPRLYYSQNNKTKYQVELKNADGDVQSSLTWNLHSPIRQILPYLVISGLVLLFGSIFISRRIIFSELKSRTRYEERLYDAATKDHLTKVANRKYFLDYVIKEFNFLTLEKRKYSLLLFDLDHFKKVNDTYGHPAGDSALIHFVTICQDVLRDSDLIGRVGGEEFAVFLADTDSEVGHKISERIRVKLTEKTINEHGMKDYKLCFSAGIASHSIGCNSFDELMKKADEALYKAKRTGRNKTVISEPEQSMENNLH